MLNVIFLLSKYSDPSKLLKETLTMRGWVGIRIYMRYLNLGVCEQISQTICREIRCQICTKSCSARTKNLLSRRFEFLFSRRASLAFVAFDLLSALSYSSADLLLAPLHVRLFFSRDVVGWLVGLVWFGLVWFGFYGKVT